MADNRGLRHAGRDAAKFSEDDPLAELARIAGEFEPRRGTADPAEAQNSDHRLEFDLEAELLRSFEADPTHGHGADADVAPSEDPEPEDIPAFLKSRPADDLLAVRPAVEPAVDDAPDSRTPDDAAVTVAPGEGIAEEWTDLPDWPVRRASPARGGWSAPEPVESIDLGDDLRSEHGENTGVVAETAPEMATTDRAAPSDLPDLAKPAEDPEAIFPDGARDAADPAPAAAEPVNAMQLEHPADHATADADGRRRVERLDRETETAWESDEIMRSFVDSEAGEGAHDDNEDLTDVRPADVPRPDFMDAEDRRAEDDAVVLPWPLAPRGAVADRLDEELLANEPADPHGIHEPESPGGAEPDSVWRDFSAYKLPERNIAPGTVAANERDADPWDIADELDAAFANLERGETTDGPLHADHTQPADVVPGEPADFPADAGAGGEDEAPGRQPGVLGAPDESGRNRSPSLDAPAPRDRLLASEDDAPDFDLAFDFDDLEMEMRSAAALLEDGSVREGDALTERETVAALREEPVFETEKVAQPSQRIPPVAVAPAAPVAAAVGAANGHNRDDLVFDTLDVTDTTAMVDPVPDLGIPDLPKDDEPPRPVVGDPDLSDLEAEFADILASDPAPEPEPGPAPAAAHDEQPVASRQGGADAIDFAQYDFSDLARSEHDHDDYPAAAMQQNAGTDALAFDDFNHDGEAFAPAAATHNGRKWMMAAGAGVLLAGVAFALFLFTGGTSENSGSPPIIAADEEPFKVVPEDPGGRTVPNQDLAVYDRVDGRSSDERANLVSRSEEPVDVVRRTLDPQVLPLEGRPEQDDPAAITAQGEASQPPTQPQASMTDTLLRGSEAEAIEDDRPRFGLEPRRVTTTVVRADGTIVPRSTVDTETPTQQAPAEAGDVVAGTSAPLPEIRPQPSAEGVEARLAPADGNSELQAPVRQVQTTAITPGGETSSEEAPPAAQAVASSGEAAPPDAAANQPAGSGLVGEGAAFDNPGGYVVQIASQPSEESARATYENLVARFQSIIGGRPAQIQAAQIPDRGTFYRVRIAGGTRDEAVSLCDRYQAAGGSCFVAR